jgi:hypothetical protein
LLIDRDGAGFFLPLFYFGTIVVSIIFVTVLLIKKQFYGESNIRVGKYTNSIAGLLKFQEASCEEDKNAAKRVYF